MGQAAAHGMDGAGHAARSAPDDTSIPDVTTADASVDAGDVRVTLSVAPRPPVAFAKKHFRVRITSGDAAMVLTGGVIWFEMKMPMGDHRYTLIAGKDGWYDAEVVLPFCPSGNPRWYANVEGAVNGHAFMARYRLDLTRPASGSTP